MVLLAGVIGLFSAGNIFIPVPIHTYIQRETPNEYMSRGGILLGALVYGLIREKVEIHLTVLTATLLMMLISIGFVTSLVKVHKI